MRKGVRVLWMTRHRAVAFVAAAMERPRRSHREAEVVG